MKAILHKFILFCVLQVISLLGTGLLYLSCTSNFINFCHIYLFPINSHICHWCCFLTCYISSNISSLCLCASSLLPFHFIALFVTYFGSIILCLFPYFMSPLSLWSTRIFFTLPHIENCQCPCFHSFLSLLISPLQYVTLISHSCKPTYPFSHPQFFAFYLCIHLLVRWGHIISTIFSQ